MESASLIAFLLVKRNGIARSAEPNAPQITAKRGRAAAAWTALRSRTATLLHRLAWAVEPDAR